MAVGRRGEYLQHRFSRGPPIYIDGAFGLSLALKAQQRYPGQIFSCSALWFAPESQMDAAAAA